MNPAAAVLIVALAFAARADEVVTKVGTKYTGTVVSEDATTVTIDTPALGRLHLAKSDVVKVTRDLKPAADAKAAEGAKKGDASKKDDAAAKAGDPAPQTPEDAAAAAAKAKADEEAAAKALAEEREARRRATKIVRRTTPQAAKPAAAPPKDGEAAAPDETKASIGGSELAKVERGSFVVVYLPPKQIDGSPSGIQIGKRFVARLDSAGAASAWLSLPMTSGDEPLLMRLTDVQRHVAVKLGQPRLTKLIEGIDRGAWLRLRLEDGSVVQGVLQAATETGLTLQRPKDDGAPEVTEVAEEKIIEVDGLLRSTSTRLVLDDLAVGEPVALMLWPDGREIIGTLKARTDMLLTVDTGESSPVKVAVDGPVVEARRVPAKWRSVVTAFTAKTTAHAKSFDEFPDAHVERDLIGTVAAVTAYAISLDTPDGILVLPWDSLTTLAGNDAGADAAAAKPMKRSERSCKLPVRPGDSAEKVKGIDPESGVSAVTDGAVVRNVLVAAPFDGEVFGIHLGDRVDDAEDRTDLRFDTIVTPRRQGVVDVKPAEMISNSLERTRVTLMLDAAGCVSAIELGAR
jgi:hypothetical protein